MAGVPFGFPSAEFVWDRFCDGLLLETESAFSSASFLFANTLPSILRLFLRLIDWRRVDFQEGLAISSLRGRLHHHRACPHEPTP